MELWEQIVLSVTIDFVDWLDEFNIKQIDVYSHYNALLTQLSLMSTMLAHLMAVTAEMDLSA